MAMESPPEPYTPTWPKPPKIKRKPRRKPKGK